MPTSESHQTSEPSYTNILRKLHERKVIPFLGAGASVYSRDPSLDWVTPGSPGFPTAQELAKYLAGQVQSYAQSDLPRAALHYAVVNGDLDLIEEMASVFGKQKASSQPTDTSTKLHTFLTEFDGILIVTTNYDTLLEDAFLRRGKPFCLVLYNRTQPTLSEQPQLIPNHLVLLYSGEGKYKRVDHDVLETMIDDGKVSIIYKIHGSPVNEPPGQPEPGSVEIAGTEPTPVLTEHDYVEFLSAMTHDRAIPKPVMKKFKESHFLFLGYSLQDWNMRIVLHQLWGEWRHSPKRKSWAILRHMPKIERDYWTSQQIVIYDMELSLFIEKVIRPQP